MTETLHQRLLADPATRTELVDALTTVVSDEIRSSRGLSGATLRSAVATLDKMKPGFVRRAVGKLLPEWIDVLQRYYDRFLLSGTQRTFGSYIVAHKDTVAEDLLVATSERAERSGNRLARALFNRIERNAHANLTAAVPRLARLMDGVLHGV